VHIETELDSLVEDIAFGMETSQERLGSDGRCLLRKLLLWASVVKCMSAMVKEDDTRA
jgi:hypothetical protein